MRLTVKLSLSFLLVSLIASGLVAAFVWSTTSSEFNRYLQDQRQNTFAVAAQNYYDQNNSWSGVQRAFQEQGLIPPPTQPGDRNPRRRPSPCLTKTGWSSSRAAPTNPASRFLPARQARSCRSNITGTSWAPS